MLVVMIVLGVCAVIAVGMYNTLIGKKNQVENTFASVDVLLKKRHDLIPNLVAAVKNYMQHEQKTLTDITELRAKAISGNLNQDERVDLENKISKAVSGIMVAVENYPDLKASENFKNLQASLNEVEEQISAARRSYNMAVTDLNNAIEMFPTNIMASMMNFKTRQLFEIPQSERSNVDVGDLFKK